MLGRQKERDGRVLAGDGRDHEHVEDLVEPEDCGARVGPAERVDERAERVQKPAGENEERCGDSVSPSSCGATTTPNPSERDPDHSGYPHGSVEPGELENDRRERAGPDDAQHDPAPVSVEGEQAEGGVGAGDEPIDPGVVTRRSQRLGDSDQFGEW